MASDRSVIRPAAKAAYLARDAKIAVIGDSQASPASLYTLPLGFKKYIDKDWAYWTHPGISGQSNAGVNYEVRQDGSPTSEEADELLTAGGLSYPNSAALTATGLNTSTGVRAKFCNNVSEIQYQHNASATSTFRTTIHSFKPASIVAWYNGSNWYDSVACRGRLLYWDGVYSAGYEPLNANGWRTSAGANVGFTPSGDGTLKAVNVALPTATNEAWIRVCGGANDESTKPARLVVGGAMLYKSASADVPDAGAGYDSTACHPSWSWRHHVDYYDELAYGRWWAVTMVPSVVIVQLGHNCETAHLNDLNNISTVGRIVQETEMIIGMIRLGAAYAAKAQSVVRSPEIILVTPWASVNGYGLTAGSQATATARAKALAERYNDVALRLGCSHANLAGVLGYVDPFSANLHPASLTELQTVTLALDTAIRGASLYGTRPLRNRRR